MQTAVIAATVVNEPAGAKVASSTTPNSTNSYIAKRLWLWLKNGVPRDSKPIPNRKTDTESSDDPQKNQVTTRQFSISPTPQEFLTSPEQGLKHNLLTVRWERVCMRFRLLVNICALLNFLACIMGMVPDYVETDFILRLQDYTTLKQKHSCLRRAKVIETIHRQPSMREKRSKD